VACDCCEGTCCEAGTSGSMIIEESGGYVQRAGMLGMVRYVALYAYNVYLR